MEGGHSCFRTDLRVGQCSGDAINLAKEKVNHNHCSFYELATIKTACNSDQCYQVCTNAHLISAHDSYTRNDSECRLTMSYKLSYKRKNSSTFLKVVDWVIHLFFLYIFSYFVFKLQLEMCICHIVFCHFWGDVTQEYLFSEKRKKAHVLPSNTNNTNVLLLQMTS